MRINLKAWAVIIIFTINSLSYLPEQKRRRGDARQMGQNTSDCDTNKIMGSLQTKKKISFQLEQQTTSYEKSINSRK